MNYIKLFEAFSTKKKSKKVHTLSGIALCVEGRLLLVKAKKYAGKSNKWSLPKGHIEGDSLMSAIKELEEETGILLDEKYDDVIEIDYRKGGVTKLMDVYVYRRPKSDFTDHLNIWDIKPELYDNNEIMGAKFFTHNGARNKIDIGMIEIIDRLEWK